MQKTLALRKNVYTKFVNSGFAIEEGALMGEILQGLKSERLSVGLTTYVFHVTPQHVTVGYHCSFGGEPGPSVVLCGDEEKVGEVERIILQNEERIIASSAHRSVSVW